MVELICSQARAIKNIFKLTDVITKYVTHDDSFPVEFRVINRKYMYKRQD